MPKYIVAYWNEDKRQWRVYWHGTSIRTARRLKKRALKEESEFAEIYERRK